MNIWDAENEQLSGAFSVKQSKASAGGTTAAQSSRRAKNAAHRADDVEFASEIGGGLLTEVHRLQSLLAARDKAIHDENVGLDRTVEFLRTALRQQEQSTDRYKEENWNLEVALEDFRTQLWNSRAVALRLVGEQGPLAKIFTTAREALDQRKSKAERS